MKVGLFNKRIWDEYSKIVSIFCGIVSFIVIFIDNILFCSIVLIFGKNFVLPE